LSREVTIVLASAPCPVSCVVAESTPRTGHNRASIARPNTPLRSRSNGRYAPKHAKYRAISTPTDERLESDGEPESTVAETGQHSRLSGCFRRTRDSRRGVTGAVTGAPMTDGFEDPRKQTFSRACYRRSRYIEGAFQLDDGIAAIATSEPRTHCGAEHECYRPNTGDNSGLEGVPCQPVCVSCRVPVDRHDPTSSQSVTVEPEGTRGNRAIAHGVDGSRSGVAVLEATALPSTQVYAH